MGKFGGIILILILLMWCCNTRKTVVEFNLIGSSGIQPELMVNGVEREIEVDDSGYAKLMLTGGECGYATLKYGKDRLPLFIEGGTTLQIYIYGDHAKGNIRFEGDGYSEQWKQEAAKRGLTNICHVPEALMRYMDNQARSVLIGERIFNETELACRLEVELEKYTMKVQIESRVLGDLAINHIVPTAVIYQNRLLENLRGLRETFTPEEYEILSADRKELIREISHRVTAIKMQVREMTEARKVANHMDNYKDKAFAYEETVRPYLESIREHIDNLEMEIDDEIWPLPKYRELLFTK